VTNGIGTAKNNQDPAYILDLGKKGEDDKTKKLTAQEVRKLKEQSEKTRQKLIDLMEKLLNRQIGNTGKSKTIEIRADGAEYKELSETQAQAAIAEDGVFGVKAVSDRIVSFAIAISGNDPEKLGELKAAIDEGFAQAGRAFGAELPEICNQTYDEIMRKLDAWAGKTTGTQQDVTA
jgi:hypothetical protein